VSGHIVALAGQPETAILTGNHEQAGDLITQIADIVFGVPVIAPENPLGNRDTVLRHWVYGLGLSDVAGDRVEIAQFIEADVIYRLVWGLEAARVYETAQDNADATALLGTAVTAIETGNLPPAGLNPHPLRIRLSPRCHIGGDQHRRRLRHGARHASLDRQPRPRPSAEPGLADTRVTVSVGDVRQPCTDPTRTPLAPADHGRTGRRLAFDGTRPRHVARVTDAGAGEIEIWSTGFDLVGEATIQARLAAVRGVAWTAAVSGHRNRPALSRSGSVHAAGEHPTSSVTPAPATDTRDVLLGFVVPIFDGVLVEGGTLLVDVGRCRVEVCRYVMPSGC
jgi:hypothetical protein